MAALTAVDRVQVPRVARPVLVRPARLPGVQLALSRPLHISGSAALAGTGREQRALTRRMRAAAPVKSTSAFTKKADDMLGAFTDKIRSASRGTSAALQHRARLILATEASNPEIFHMTSLTLAGARRLRRPLQCSCVTVTLADSRCAHGLLRPQDPGRAG
jgi:hypothetical protein